MRRRYLLEKSPGPSCLARYVHWHATPVAINSLAAVEDRLERFRKIACRFPAAALACAFTFGALLGNRTDRR